MDIPLEWMILSQAVRKDKVDLGSEEIDFKWSPSAEFYRPIASFSGDKTLKAEWGTLAAAYTSTNLLTSWGASSLRLRGEVSYASYLTDLEWFRLHDIHVVAGMYLQPQAVRWGSGGVGFLIGGLWEQWFGPESKNSLAQAGGGGGMQTAIEIRQDLGGLLGSEIKLITSICRRDYFVATPYHRTWLGAIGMGFSL